MTGTGFDGWLPIGVRWSEAAQVDWCHFGDSPLTEPFFEDSVARRLREPFNQAFRRLTPLERLGEFGCDDPAGRPAGFIFHLSRCGSTWLCQLLAADPTNIVLSEPPAVDDVLSAGRRIGATDDQRVGWLRGLLRSYSQVGRRLFVKFDSWAVFDLPLIRRTFPDVPWAFLYRHPAEVLASHLREPGRQMVPGVLPAEWLHGQPREAQPGVESGVSDSGAVDPRAAGPRAEYISTVLAATMTAAETHCGERLVNYADLAARPLAVVADLFGPALGDDRASLSAVARRHAKHPDRAFEPDSVQKQAGLSAAESTALQERALPAYERLEQLRLATGFVPATGHCDGRLFDRAVVRA